MRRLNSPWFFLWILTCFVWLAETSRPSAPVNADAFINAQLASYKCERHKINKMSLIEQDTQIVSLFR